LGKVSIPLPPLPDQRRIAEVLVQWEYVGTRRVDPIRESWRGLNGLLAIRLNDLRGRYRGLSLAGKRAALR